MISFICEFLNDTSPEIFSHNGLYQEQFRDFDTDRKLRPTAFDPSKNQQNRVSMYRCDTSTLDILV